MGRSRKKAAARKREADRGALPQLAPSVRRERNGKAKRPPKAERGADRPTLDARARHMGWADSDRARAQSLEGEAGRALHAGVDDAVEREALWGTWTRFSAARLAYHLRVLGRSPHAAGAKLEMLPERLEVRPDDRPDPRSPQERDEDARIGWRRWATGLATLDPVHRDALRDAVAETVPLVRDAGTTAAGRGFLAALRALHAWRCQRG